MKMKEKILITAVWEREGETLSTEGAGNAATQLWYVKHKNSVGTVSLAWTPAELERTREVYREAIGPNKPINCTQEKTYNTVGE